MIGQNVGPHYTQTYKKKHNKTWFLLQATRGKDEPTIVLMRTL